MIVNPIAPALWGYEIHNTVLLSFKRGRITKEEVERLLSLRYHTALSSTLPKLRASRSTAIATLDNAFRSAARNGGVSLPGSTPCRRPSAGEVGESFLKVAGTSRR